MARRIGANQRLKRNEKKYKRKEKRPAHFQQVIKVMKVICLVLLIAGASVFVAMKSNALIDKVSILKISKVQVKGNTVVKTSDILSLAAIEMDISLFKINVSEIKNKLYTVPEVKTVKVRKRIPGTVIINIVERKPIAMANAGLMYLFDSEGVMWPIKPNTYWDLPIVSGAKDTVLKNDIRMIKKSEIKKINSFFKTVNKIDKSFAMDLSQIDFHDSDELKVSFESKPTIVRLSRRNIRKNILNLNKIYTNLENKQENMPRHINLCFNNMAFVK